MCLCFNLCLVVAFMRMWLRVSVIWISRVGVIVISVIGLIVIIVLLLSDDKDVSIDIVVVIIFQHVIVTDYYYESLMTNTMAAITIYCHTYPSIVIVIFIQLFILANVNVNAIAIVR